MSKNAAIRLCLAALVMLGALSVQAQDSWRGAGIMAGGKGYAPTPMGQIHYRDIGPRDARLPLLLIHQSLMSLVEFAEIQDYLAALGYRSVAVDLPGHGMSDPAPGQPSIEDLAENLLPVLDFLKINRVVLVGHHTGSLLAAHLAARHPDRVAALIMHGVPYFNQEESAAGLAKIGSYDRTPVEDGSHMSKFFTYHFQGDPVPNTPENMRSRTWMLISSFMMGPNIGHYAVFHYDLTADAKAISAPALILTDSNDGIHNLDLRLAALRPDFHYQVFSENSGIQMMNEPARWSSVVAEFIAPYQQ